MGWELGDEMRRGGPGEWVRGIGDGRDCGCMYVWGEGMAVRELSVGEVGEDGGWDGSWCLVRM